MLVAASGLGCDAPLAESPVLADDGEPPNVLLVLTDDQDVGLIEYMPRVRRELEHNGVSFTNSFVSFPLCCPSRATLLSGQYAHNHGVLANEQAGELDLRNSLPVWLKGAGYATSYIGKFLNGYPIKGEPLRDPPGWDDFVSPAVAITDMYHYKLMRNGELRSFGSKGPSYKTDVLGGFALRSLERLTDRDQPFFMTFAPTAPHAELHVEACNDPRSSPASRNRFRKVDAPRSGAFNETKIGDKPKHVRSFPELDRAARDLIDCHHRARARSVLDVDRYVGQMLDILERSGELDDTFVIFTSDNGFLTGQHRIASGKTLPYDESTRVPLIVRGPGIPEGIERRQLVVKRRLGGDDPRHRGCGIGEGARRPLAARRGTRQPERARSRAAARGGPLAALPGQPRPRL